MISVVLIKRVHDSPGFPPSSCNEGDPSLRKVALSV